MVGELSESWGRFPLRDASTCRAIRGFLAAQGGYEYKRSIVETLVAIINKIPEAKEVGLSHLCEFIEDCEFVSLSTRVLHLLGEEGPLMPKPSRVCDFAMATLAWGVGYGV